MTREKKGIFLSRVRVWYPFPNLGNSQKKNTTKTLKQPFLFTSWELQTLPVT